MNLKRVKRLFKGHRAESRGGYVPKPGPWPPAPPPRHPSGPRQITSEEVSNLYQVRTKPPEPRPTYHDDMTNTGSIDYRALLLAYMTRVLDCEGISFLDANGHHSPLTDAQMDALMVIKAEAVASLQV